MFKKATKQQSRLRLALSGPSGCGKTYSALNIAQHLGKNIAVIDTEHGSASKYADRFQFDVCELGDFHPGNYINLLREAAQAEYEVIIIDSLSHAWFWELDKTSQAQNSFAAWGDVRKLERALIHEMLGSPAHIIGTMRTKTEWVLEEDQRGKTMPRKVGMAPIQASGIEYEFDLAGEMDLNHILSISKSRCPALANTTHANPGESLADTLMLWLTDGSPMEESGESKSRRVRLAREAVGLDLESVRTLITTEFDGRTNPRQLSSEECDRLVDLIAMVAGGHLNAKTAQPA
jgi:hypothetical protein